MTQAKPRFPNFAAYLNYSQAAAIEGRYELIEGELVELPPESGANNLIAQYLLFQLAANGVVPLELLVIHACEVQVRVLEPKDPANRFPDLVVLRQEHVELTQNRLTITLDMPPPRLIVEIVSLGRTNHERDYIRKRSQYADLGVAEYWIIDPQSQVILVLELQGDDYGDGRRISGELCDCLAPVWSVALDSKANS